MSTSLDFFPVRRTRRPALLLAPESARAAGEWFKDVQAAACRAQAGRRPAPEGCTSAKAASVPGLAGFAAALAGRFPAREDLASAREDFFPARGDFFAARSKNGHFPASFNNINHSKKGS